MSSTLSSLSSSSSSTRSRCRQFSLYEINDAVNLFGKSKLLGEGGEAKVYLSQISLDGEKTFVAVKHLKSNSKEFETEIETVSKIHHPHLVDLLGYCEESNQKILVYEFMEKGNLAKYVNTKSASSISLSWQQRLTICLGAARGLQYLHAETDEFPFGIIHRDVKPDNILLDENLVAKVSDFGLVKLSLDGQMKSSIVTNLKGTGGYYAPEYIKYGKITRKIDVYAFGVVMFQVLCQKMPWDRGNESYYGSEDEDLGLWAQNNVDPRIKGDIPKDALKLFTLIIGRSLQANSNRRPTMDAVVLQLEKALSISSSSNLSRGIEDSCYEIYLCFNGADTGNTFTRLLYDALVLAGFHTFMDVKDTYSDMALEAMRTSMNAIVIFSPKFVSSTWCRDQLIFIMEERRKRSNYFLLPILFRIDRGKFFPYFNNEGRKKHGYFGDSSKQRWTAALTIITRLPYIAFAGLPTPVKMNPCIQAVVEEMKNQLHD